MQGRDATPYLERNRVGRDAIDSAAALTDMGKYLFRERRLPVYDIAVAITKLDMCRRQYANDQCNRGTAGFAYVGGACVVNKRLEKVNSVAIIEDTGGFSGIIVAAHEVGHLLGAVHDGSPPPSYLGGPGAEKCRWEDGYIMSDLRHTERGFRWSPCSVQSFHHFLNGDTASCLHNAPHEDEALGRALPGTLLSLDAQCRRDRGTSACFKDERVCAQLFCFDSASGYCVAYRPAAEGSSCGDGQHCMDGRCVAEHENIIPDYSQHTPSYASPNSYNSQNVKHGLYSYKDDNDEERYTTALTTSTTTTTTPRTTITTVQAPTSPPTTTTTSPTPTTTTVKSNYFNNAYHNTFQKFGETSTRSPINWNTQKSTTRYSTFSTKFAFYKSTTVSPYDWLYYKTKTPAGRSLEVKSDNSSSSTRSPYANIKPSTYKSVFDVYFNQIASYKKKNNI
uniref:CSON003880 protein n=1 Tax=Culicoides sonorensis TaxID=179676 RepID=A0A336MTP9_CULSO